MYLDNIIVAALEVATVIVCPVTAPLIAGAHVADCAYDMNENGPTTGNVLGCAAAVVGVTGIPGGKQALDAIGFGEKGVRAGSAAAKYQSAQLGGEIAKGSWFARAMAKAMRA